MDDADVDADTGDHSPPEFPEGRSRLGRAMDAPFIITVVVALLLIAAFIFFLHP